MPRPVIRHVTRLFSPEIGAGAFRQRKLADAFARLGASVDVMTSRPPATSPPIDDGVLRVRRWPVLRDRSGNIRGYLPYLSFDVPVMVRALVQPRPDVYVVEPPPTTGLAVALVAWLQRRPYVWYAADIWSEAASVAGAPGPLVRGLRIAEGWVARRAQTVLAVSDHVAQRLPMLGVDLQRVVTVGNGVDTDEFTPQGPRAERDGGYFVYAGTMSEWQGATVFIEALAELDGDTRIVFLGQGSQSEEIRALAERLIPGRVELLGLLPPQETATYLRGARAALVSIRPGIGYDFAVPTKIYAATSCGSPVIFAGGEDAAGRRTVVQGGLGWTADYDPAKVAQAMAQALGPDRPDRDYLRRWTLENASLAVVAERAARRVLVRAGWTVTE